MELASKFTIEDEGDISGYLGINITWPSPGMFELNQPALIQRIINFLGLKDNWLHDTPAEPNVQLTKDANGVPRKDVPVQMTGEGTP